jgi:tetratricopeptide (TPR) repeat protein
MPMDASTDQDLIGRWQDMLERGAYRDLVTAAEPVLASRPGFAEALFAKGYAHMKLGELPEAAASLCEVTRLKPDQLSVYKLYFPILWQLNRKDELQDAVESLLGADLSGADVDLMRGDWLHRLNRHDEAVTVLRRAAEAGPGRPEIRLALGASALAAEDPDPAIHALRAAVLLDPGLREAYRPFGEALERRLDLDAAARIYSQGLAAGDTRCAFPLTRVYKGLNRCEDSVAVGRRAGIDAVHFRSGVTVGSLDRAGIADLDAYAFRGAEETAPAEIFADSGTREVASGKANKWHFQPKSISFFPRSNQDFADLDRLVREHVISRSIPEAPIFGSDANILTMGSCFAGHLRKRLLARRGTMELISVPEGLNNTFALRQFIEWSLTGNIDSGAYWYDQLEDGGIDRWMPPAEHAFYRRSFEAFDGFVITIGLAEVWRDKQTGGVFWRGVPQNIFDEGCHAFQISSVDENADNMAAIVDLVRTHCGAKPVIFTLSPVPLIATHRTDVTCMLADSVSKSILRVAIDQVMRRGLEDVYYWPSFEIVRWASGHASYSAFGDDDGAPRHVNDRHVGTIIDAFIEHFFAPRAAGG